MFSFNLCIDCWLLHKPCFPGLNLNKLLLLLTILSLTSLYLTGMSASIALTEMIFNFSFCNIFFKCEYQSYVGLTIQLGSLPYLFLKLSESGLCHFCATVLILVYLKKKLILWPIFWLGHLFFWNWAAGVACIFLRLVICQLLHLLLFSPIQKAVFSPCFYFPLLCRSF